MIRRTITGKYNDIKLGLSWFLSRITQHLYINYPFGPNILTINCLVLIINIIGLYSPINYMISSFMENIFNTVKIGLGNNPLYNIRGPHGQQGIYCHEVL